MADLEDDLRRVLSDPARALAPWPDAVQRVHIGIRRRHAHRVLNRIWIALAVGVATLFAALGPALLTEHPQPLPTLAPSAAPSVSPPAETACRAADLRLVPARGGVAGGTATYFARVRNDGSSTCTLSGRPVLRQTRDGRTTEVRVKDAGREFPPGTSPAVLAPGEYADLAIETYNACPAVIRNGIVTATLAVAVGGREFQLPARFDVGCGIGESEWHRTSPQPALNTRDLTVAISDVGPARYGEDLTFTVTLVNPTPDAVRLEPCPDYFVDIGREPSLPRIGTVDRLPCADYLAIPGTSAVPIPVRLALPPLGPDEPGPGPATLTFTLDGGAADSVPITLSR